MGCGWVIDGLGGLPFIVAEFSAIAFVTVRSALVHGHHQP